MVVCCDVSVSCLRGGISRLCPVTWQKAQNRLQFHTFPLFFIRGWKSQKQVILSWHHTCISQQQQNWQYGFVVATVFVHALSKFKRCQIKLTDTACFRRRHKKVLHVISHWIILLTRLGSCCFNSIVTVNNSFNVLRKYTVTWSFSNNFIKNVKNCFCCFWIMTRKAAPFGKFKEKERKWLWKGQKEPFHLRLLQLHYKLIFTLKVFLIRQVNFICTQWETSTSAKNDILKESESLHYLPFLTQR